jgi:hypothetical protein
VTLDLPCTAHAPFPECLNNRRQGLRFTFPRFAQHFVVSSSDLWRHRIKPDTGLQIKEHKKLRSPFSCVKFCTLASKICWYHHLQLHRAATNAVQKAAPDQEIMDIPSYSIYIYTFVIIIIIKYLHHNQAYLIESTPRHCFFRFSQTFFSLLQFSNFT